MPVPPLALTVIDPSDEPSQLVGVLLVLLMIIAAGSVTNTVLVAVQLFASVTEIVIAPDPAPVKEAGFETVLTVAPAVLFTTVKV